VIVQHPTQTFKIAYGGVERGYCIECSYCQRLSPAGQDMHHAVEKGYSAGYSTVPGDTHFDPRRWRCPVCASKQRA
jgi:hypothetical protein